MICFFKQNRCKSLVRLQHVFLILTVFILSNVPLEAKPKLDFQVGYSYIEHLSTGIGLTIYQKHNISVLYGSNFFINPQNFSSYLFQYEYSIGKLEKIPYLLVIGDQEVQPDAPLAIAIRGEDKNMSGYTPDEFIKRIKNKIAARSDDLGLNPSSSVVL